MGVSIRRESTQGVSEINPASNLIEFFQTQIIPELQDTNHQNRPVVKATSIKFIATFRNQYTHENIVQLFPILISHLSSPVVVVHTFASYAIERILTCKDERGQRKMGSQALNSFLEPLFTGLFGIIENKELNENFYAMKCVTRALAIVGPGVRAVTQIVITKLTEVLGRIAKNPRNPQFNHYLFESIAVLIRNVCSEDPSATSSFEALLFPPFNTVLQMRVEEFTPYVFQVLSQLLEYRPRESGLGSAYEQLFPPLMTGEIWEKGKVPALSRLLLAYLRQAGPSLVEFMVPVLGIFQKLLSARSTAENSFIILNGAILYFPQEHLNQHLKMIFTLIFTRLQESRTPKFLSYVTNFFAIFIGKFGPICFYEVIEQIQPGMTKMIVKDVWASHVVTSDPSQRTHAKTQVVGLTKLLCEAPVRLLSDGTGDAAWGMGVAAVVKLLGSQTLKDSTEIADLVDDEKVEVCYDAQFSQLQFARKRIEDPFPDIGDPVTYFCQSLSSLSAQQPGRLGPLIQARLSDDPKLQATFQSLIQTNALTLG